MTQDHLSQTQKQVLQYAIEHNSERIHWFPENVKGGAREKVIASLSKRALITPSGSDWLVAAKAYEALGLPQRGPITLAALNAVIDAAEKAQPAATQKIQTREQSKQASVIRMLKRPEGATVAQICAATGWQAHTVRGAFAGAFKKKLGLIITSDKAQGGERIYRAT